MEATIIKMSFNALSVKNISLAHTYTTSKPAVAIKLSLQRVPTKSWLFWETNRCYSPCCEVGDVHEKDCKII